VEIKNSDEKDDEDLIEDKQIKKVFEQFKEKVEGMNNKG
jgi:hypothetical protein